MTGKKGQFLWKWIFLSDSSWLSHTKMNWLCCIYDHKTSSDGKLFLWGNWQDAVIYTPLSCRLRCQVMLLQSTPYGGRSLVNIVWWFISFSPAPLIMLIDFLSHLHAWPSALSHLHLWSPMWGPEVTLIVIFHAVNMYSTVMKFLKKFLLFFFSFSLPCVDLIVFKIFKLNYCHHLYICI